MTEVTGLARNDNERGLYNEIPAAQRAAPTFCGALHRKRRDLIIAHPTGESFQRERARTPFPFGRFKGKGFLREGGNPESPFP